MMRMPTKAELDEFMDTHFVCPKCGRVCHDEEAGGVVQVDDDYTHAELWCSDCDDYAYWDEDSRCTVAYLSASQLIREVQAMVDLALEASTDTCVVRATYLQEDTWRITVQGVFKIDGETVTGKEYTVTEAKWLSAKQRLNDIKEMNHGKSN